MEKCKVDGCEKLANRVGAGLCEKHYMRQRRNGTTQSVYERAANLTPQSGGYLYAKAKGHFLARGTSRAYAHRLAFHEANGDGPFLCHWCGVEVTWADMHIDHLDDHKHNNHHRNLVASCPVCNMRRGHHKVVETHRAKTGITYEGETLTPNEWAARVGISRVSLLWRIKQGWPLSRALTEGRGVTGPQTKKPDVQ